MFQYQKALVAKVIDTLGDLPNIIWEVCNEAFPETMGFPWQIALANYITAYEQSRGFTPHLVMPRDIPNHENTPGYFVGSGCAQDPFRDGIGSLIEHAFSRP